MASPEAVGKALGLKHPLLITDGITSRQMAILLKEAAADAEAMITANLAKQTFSGRMTAAQLRTATAGIGQMSTELWTGVGKITQAGMYHQAQLAADQALDLDLVLGMPAMGILQYAKQIHFDAAQAVNDVISRRTEGFKLADGVYQGSKQTVQQVGRIVEKNLILQRSAKDIARAVRDHISPSTPGGTSYAAMRLGRTEINNAHHTTTVRLAQDKPWITAMKWNISSSHPKPDECDQYAAHDEGLGEGVFTKQNVPRKPHPQCFCYVTHVQQDEDEFMNDLVNGKYDDWMSAKGVTC